MFSDVLKGKSEIFQSFHDLMALDCKLTTLREGLNWLKNIKAHKQTSGLDVMLWHEGQDSGRKKASMTGIYYLDHLPDLSGESPRAAKH